MTFIDELAKIIYETSGDDLKNTAIVLPGRRSGLYLKKTLPAYFKKTILLPNIITIEEYIFSQSGIRKIDETALLALLYNVYKNYSKDNAFPIDEFIPTGRTILADFNDVDDYLLNPDEVFTHLFKIREIENWYPGEANTDLQKKYLSFYKLLHPIYEVFTSNCIENKIGYQGLASRLLSQKESFDEYSKVIFAGLNAITPSLKKHIDLLLENGKADMVWDADKWYLNNLSHEAGHFLRQNRYSWSDTFKEPAEHIKNNEKNIEVIGAPLGYSQIQVALNKLESDYSDKFSDTVLVLADESLLMPLLSSLPNEWSNKVNISGGFPLVNTFAGQFIKNYFAMINAISHSKGDIVFHFDAFSALLANPLVNLLVQDDKIHEFRECVEVISSGKFRFFYWNAENREDSALLQRVNELTNGLFSPYNSWESIAEMLISKMDMIFERSVEIEIEHEAAWQMRTMLNVLINTFQKHDIDKDINILAFSYFVKRQIQSLKIPLKGEPIKGLQILGMLETRSLDFKNVIIVGANEGNLPAAANKDSFLPVDLRRALKLPLQSDRDSVYAYHFWRLIQRAENIVIIYNTEPDALFGKEPSRYIAQIEHELLPASSNIAFNRISLDIGYNGENSLENISTLKDKENKLKELAQKGISFSAFFNFVLCPYKFLLENVYKIEEWKNKNADIQFNTMGNIFHKAIENISKPYLKRVLLKQDFDSMISSVEKNLNDAFKIYEVANFESGYNFLVKDLLFDALNVFLKKSAENIPNDFYLEALEYDLDIDVALKDGTIVKVKGIADRIEVRSGIHYIMDFKTTYKRFDLNLEKKSSEIADLFNKNNQYLIQVLFYIWLYSASNNVNKISGGIYSVLNKNGYKPDVIYDNENDVKVFSKEEIAEFSNYCISILEEIFSKEQQFKATTNKQNCLYCPYNGVICFSNDGEVED